MLFGRKKRSPPPAAPGSGVGLYGKHPAAGDFLRVNATSQEVGLLDEWLSSGLDRARRVLPDFEGAYGGLFSAAFLLCFSGDNRAGGALLGVMAPSRDEIGRQFPLIIFAHLSRALSQQGFHTAPCEGFLDAASRLLQRRNSMTRDELLRSVEALVSPDAASQATAAETLSAHLSQTPWLAAANTMFGLSAPMQTGRALDLVRQVNGGLRADRPLPRYGLRCPLGQQAQGNAGFWLSLLRAGVTRPLQPGLLWSLAHHKAPSRLVIYPGACSSKAVPALLDPEWQDDGICDLATWDEDPTPPATLPPPDRPLQELVDAASGRLGD